MKFIVIVERLHPDHVVKCNGSMRPLCHRYRCFYDYLHCCPSNWRHASFHRRFFCRWAPTKPLNKCDRKETHRRFFMRSIRKLKWERFKCGMKSQNVKLEKSKCATIRWEYVSVNHALPFRYYWCTRVAVQTTSNLVLVEFLIGATAT